MLQEFKGPLSAEISNVWDLKERPISQKACKSIPRKKREGAEGVVHHRGKRHILGIAEKGKGSSQTYTEQTSSSCRAVDLIESNE